MDHWEADGVNLPLYCPLDPPLIFSPLLRVHSQYTHPRYNHYILIPRHLYIERSGFDCSLTSSYSP